MGKKRRRQQYDEGEYQVTKRKEVEELPEGVQHYHHHSEMPWDIQKYYASASLDTINAN
jgi:hypothetical protein